jgi:hypothetical protein
MGATHRKLRPRVVLHQQSARQGQVRLRSMRALTPARAKIDPPATSGHRLMPTDATTGRLRSWNSRVPPVCPRPKTPAPTMHLMHRRGRWRTGGLRAGGPFATRRSGARIPLAPPTENSLRLGTTLISVEHSTSVIPTRSRRVPPACPRRFRRSNPALSADGVPATGDLTYAGVTRLGGSIDANIRLRADGAKATLHTASERSPGCSRRPSLPER